MKKLPVAPLAVPTNPQSMHKADVEQALIRARKLRELPGQVIKPPLPIAKPNLLPIRRKRSGA